MRGLLAIKAFTVVRRVAHAKGAARNIHEFAGQRYSLATRLFGGDAFGLVPTFFLGLPPFELFGAPQQFAELFVGRRLPESLRRGCQYEHRENDHPNRFQR